MKLVTFAALGLLATGAHGQAFIIGLGTHLIARMDPIVNPGVVAEHTHSIMGASNFREVLNTPEEQQRAVCTTANVAADKSNYWAPTMYYIHDNGTYAAMSTSTRAYYKVNGKNVQPFPKGLRMVTGTAMSKDPKDIRALPGSLGLGCNGNSAGLLPNKGWKWSTCGGDNTVELGINFPSCGWANQSLDSWDHFSHMAWPLDTVHGNVTSAEGDSCPPSHPIHYPTIMLVNFNRGLGSEAMPWRPGKDNVVLSNGDLLGTTFHADFVSGWDEGVLADAIAHCSGDNSVGPDVERCSAFKPSFQQFDFTQNTQCVYQGQIPNEDVGLLYPIDKLPGCNPIWPADQLEKPTCQETSQPGFVSPNAWKGGSENTFPFVLFDDLPGLYNVGQMAFSMLSKWGPWGTLGINKDKVMIPTEAKINGWLPFDKNPQPRSKSFGMVDDTAWTGGMTPGGTGNQKPPLPLAESPSGAAAPAGDSSASASSSQSGQATDSASSASPASSGSSASSDSSSASTTQSSGGISASAVQLNVSPPNATDSAAASGAATQMNGIPSHAAFNVDLSASASGTDSASAYPASGSASPAAAKPTGSPKKCKRSRARRARAFTVRM